MSGVVFLGNGINRAFNQASWTDLVKNIYEKNNSELPYNEKSSLPMPMQIIVATGDKVDKAMQDISVALNFDITDEQKKFIESILELPVKNIITANYTFEIEQTAGVRNSMHSYRKIRKLTKKCSAKDEKFNLFKTYEPESCDKRIWHIHGDIATASSIIMGNYYYGKLLREIQDYLPSFMRRYTYSRKNNTELTEYSWVDSFLSKNVYMLGFGLDFNESDIWWLICCKKRHFPDTKIYFYQPSKDISDEQRALLKAYAVEIIDFLPFDDSYIEFYNCAIDDIKTKLKGEN